MEKVRVRESNLELYRIIVMLLIVAHHYVVNSGLLAAGGPIASDILSGKSLFLLLFGAWGKTGINCFVLITGYFMCKSEITVKKFLKLLLEVMFYRIVINIVFWLTSYNELTLKGVLSVIIPIRNIGTGFTAAYIMFFLFIPFFNILVRNMTEKQHIYLLCLCSFLYIFLGTFPLFSVTMNYVSWFSVLYFISSYIRLYPKKIFEKTKVWGFATLLFVLIASLSVIIGAYIADKTGKLIWYYFVQDSNTLLAVLIGLSSFLLFKNLKIKNSKLINTVSATCFGVLLIHANGDVMRKWLWQDVLNNVGMFSSSFIILHAVLSVIGVFIICSSIDLLRIRFIEKPFFCWYDKHFNQLR